MLEAPPKRRKAVSADTIPHVASTDGQTAMSFEKGQRIRFLAMELLPES